MATSQEPSLRSSHSIASFSDEASPTTSKSPLCVSSSRSVVSVSRESSTRKVLSGNGVLATGVSSS